MSNRHVEVSPGTDILQQMLFRAIDGAIRAQEKD